MCSPYLRCCSQKMLHTETSSLADSSWSKRGRPLKATRALIRDIEENLNEEEIENEDKEEIEDARKNKFRPNKFSKGQEKSYFGQKNLISVKKILFWLKKSYLGQK